MSKQFNFRCPDDLYEAIEAQASAQGVEKTAIVLQALRVQLGLPRVAVQGPVDTGLSIRVGQVEAQLAAVIAQLAELQTSPAKATQSKPEPSKPAVVQGQLGFLDDQEQPPAQEGERFTLKQAFEALGGNLADKDSTVSTLAGDKRLRWNTFRLEKTDYRAFGFEVDRSPGRREVFLIRRNSEGVNNER